MTLLSSFANLINKINYIYIHIVHWKTYHRPFKTILPVDHNYAYLKISTPRPLDHEQDIKLNYINFQANNKFHSPVFDGFAKKMVLPVAGLEPDKG